MSSMIKNFPFVILTWLGILGLSATYPMTFSTDSFTVSEPAPGTHVTRLKRSCNNYGMLTLFVGACNKNHKRSPEVMNLIYVHYFIPPEILTNQISGSASMPEGSVIMIPEDSLALQDPTMDLTMISGNDEEPMRGHQLRERLKRVPYAVAPLLSVVDKCCTVGCSELDFHSHC